MARIVITCITRLSISQSVSQSINQSINQSTNQSIFEIAALDLIPMLTYKTENTLRSFTDSDLEKFTKKVYL